MNEIILSTTSISLSLFSICLILTLFRKLNKHKKAIEKLLYPEIAQEKRCEDEIQRKIHQIKMGKTPSLIGIQLSKKQFEELAPYVTDKSYLENTLRARVPLAD